MSQKKVVIAGGKSMIGRYLAGELGDQVLCLSRNEMDITDSKSIKSIIRADQVSMVINAAGTAKAEQREMFEINAFAAAEMAKYCGEKDLPYIFFSTARVFDGKQRRPYSEFARPNPIEDYGLSKYLGEKLVKKALKGKRFYIFRLPMVLGIRAVHRESQIIYRLLELAKKQRVINVANDVLHSPIYARDAAKMLWDCLNGNCNPGIYHLTGSESVSLHDLVVRIINHIGLDTVIHSVPQDYFGSYKKFPRYTVLTSEKIQPSAGWRDAADKFMQEFMADDTAQKIIR